VQSGKFRVDGEDADTWADQTATLKSFEAQLAEAEELGMTAEEAGLVRPKLLPRVDFRTLALTDTMKS
jgi:hypothetical protein